MSSDDEARHLRYHRSLNFLSKNDARAVRSILAMLNELLVSQGEKKIRDHYELAGRMRNYEIYMKVRDYADGLIQDNKTRETFMKMCRDESGDPREAQVADYLQDIPEGSILTPKATLNDMILFLEG